MNAKLLYLAGLVLAMAPFRLSSGNWHFFYSLLGYAMILCALVIRRSKFPDELLAGISISILAAGLMNVDNLYILLQAVFLFAATLKVYLMTGKKWIENSAFAILFVVPVLFTMLTLNAIGLYFFTYLMDPLFYFVFGCIIVLNLIYYWFEDRKEVHA
jgi:uncharacterized membrane protein